MDLGMSDLSEQQERFCRLIVQGMNQRDAYKAAGYKTTTDGATDANASRLLSNAKIDQRIAELRRPIAAEASVTLAWLIEQAREVLVAAKADNAHTAAIAAIKELGILSGERVERSERTNRNITVDDLSDSDLSAYLTGNGREGTVAPSNGAAGPDSVH